jgi:hypothetical protein
MKVFGVDVGLMENRLVEGVMAGWVTPVVEVAGVTPGISGGRRTGPPVGTLGGSAR